MDSIYIHTDKVGPTHLRRVFQHERTVIEIANAEGCGGAAVQHSGNSGGMAGTDENVVPGISHSDENVPVGITDVDRWVIISMMVMCNDIIITGHDGRRPWQQ